MRSLNIYHKTKKAQNLLCSLVFPTPKTIIEKMEEKSERSSSHELTGAAVETLGSERHLVHIMEGRCIRSHLLHFSWAF